MNFVFVGLLLGSIVISNHDTREACEGRAVMLREKGVSGSCHQSVPSFGATGTIQFCNGTTCSNSIPAR